MTAVQARRWTMPSRRWRRLSRYTVPFVSRYCWRNGWGRLEARTCAGNRLAS
jgi:hypothetical protein